MGLYWADMTRQQNTSANQRSYGAARAHSRRVALFKVLLPALALVGMVGLGAQFYLTRIVLPDEVDVDLSQSVISDGNLVMANPEMAGTTADNRSYAMTAERAIQSLDDQASVLLETIRADFELRDGVKAKLTAPKGSYNRDINALGLQGQSSFSTSDGMSVRFEDAQIDVEAGNFLTSNPVQIDRNGTLINAGSMKIMNNGDVVVFETDVQITIPPGAVPKTAAPTRPAQAESGETQ